MRCRHAVDDAATDSYMLCLMSCPSVGELQHSSIEENERRLLIRRRNREIEGVVRGTEKLQVSSGVGL